MSRNALQIFQAEDPVGYEVLRVAAELSRSEKIPPVQRAVLLIEIADAVAPYIVKAAAEASIDEVKPKFRWVNGARIKVK